MRSSILVTSALAMGAVAIPRPQGWWPNAFVETVVVHVTKTVGCTAPGNTAGPVGQPAPASRSSSAVNGAANPVRTSLAQSSSRRSSSTLVVRPTSNAAPVVRPSSSAVRPVSSAAPVVRPSSSVVRPASSAAAPVVRPSSSAVRPVSSAAPVVRPSSSAVRPVSSAAATPSSGTGLNAHISGSAQAYLSSGTDYQNAILYHHNAARANHGAAPLTWDTTCEANARLAANRCTFAHYIPDGVFEGQNIFTVSGTAFNVTAGITEYWYKSELPPMMPYFGDADLPDDVFHSVGHLTQLVWKGTTSVGCVTLDCGTRMIVNGAQSNLNKFTVCNYAPAGNIGGQYAVNVLPPISTTNLGSWSD